MCNLPPNPKRVEKKLPQRRQIRKFLARMEAIPPPVQTMIIQNKYNDNIFYNIYSTKKYRRCKADSRTKATGQHRINCFTINHTPSKNCYFHWRQSIPRYKCSAAKQASSCYAGLISPPSPPASPTHQTLRR